MGLELFAGVMVGLLILRGLYDLATSGRRRTIELSERYTQKLPLSTATINEHGQRQLRLALILLAQATENTQLQEESTALAAKLLSDAVTGSPAELLQRAALLLHRIQSENRMVDLIPRERAHQIDVWLDEYLHARGD